MAEYFNAAKIRAPVHLYSNNEEQMIDIFKKIRPQDWVSLMALTLPMSLKGCPVRLGNGTSIEGKSIALVFRYNVYSSAIVGGVLPISVGTAMSIRK